MEIGSEWCNNKRKTMVVSIVHIDKEHGIVTYAYLFEDVVMLPLFHKHIVEFMSEFSLVDYNSKG